MGIKKMKSNTKVLIAYAALIIVTLTPLISSSRSFMKKSNEALTRNTEQRKHRTDPPAPANVLADGSSSASASTSTTGEDPVFKDLVTVQKPKGLCRSDEDKKYKTPSDKMKLPGDYNVYGPPYKKKNNYIQEAGKLDQIQYFFDYIDDIFQKKVSEAFKLLIDEASKVQVDENDANFDEPYSADKLLFYWSNGQEGRDPVKGDDKPQPTKPEELTKYKKDFNPDDWKNSFSAAKIAKIIKLFGWSSNTNMPFFWKRLIDKYDFDGNGRLDTREFLFYAVWENYKNYMQCKKHCFKDIIDKLINPLFTFFDCDTDGYIDSENLWDGCKFLKRTNAEKYDFYKCEVPKPFNKFYRTHAPNDFVLRNWDVADGYLNREEFRKGILLGYWERQAMAHKIVTDDENNKKVERWDATGMKDKDCAELLLMYRGH